MVNSRLPLGVEADTHLERSLKRPILELALKNLQSSLRNIWAPSLALTPVRSTFKNLLICK